MISRLVVVAVVAGGALPATAAAGTSSTVALNKVLSGQGVKVAAVAPARIVEHKVVLPVTSVSGASVRHGGAIRLRKGPRTVTLAAPTIRTGKGGRLSAKLGKATMSVFAVEDGRLRLTVKGAAAIRKALRLRRLSAVVVGTLRVGTKPTTTPSGSGDAPTGATTTGATTPTGGGATPTATPTAPAASCLTSTAAGGPSPLARPATAVDVASASITWHVRDSFIQYINAGEGTATCNGASADPPSVQPGSGAALAYDFHFAFKDGWYDPVSQTARVTFTGAVSFRYAGHGIALAAANPEIEIDNLNSRGIFTTSNTGEAAKRGVLEDLDLAGASSITPGQAYNKVPGRIPSDASSSTFAGYYAAGDPFGWVTLALQTA